MPSPPQSLVVLDVEGVLTPEVWIAVAERTGIDFLRRTTRDEPDYDVLMKGRIAALDAAGITMTTIMEVVEGLVPLPGARRFLEELHSRVPVVLLSDTFEQFGRPLMAQLGWPLLLCHTLVVEGRPPGRLPAAGQRSEGEVGRSLPCPQLPGGRGGGLLQRHDHVGRRRLRDPVPGAGQRDCRAPAVPLLHGLWGSAGPDR